MDELKKGGAGKGVITRIRKAQNVFQTLKETWNSGILTIRTKIRIFNCSILFLVLCLADTWRIVL